MNDFLPITETVSTPNEERLIRTKTSAIAILTWLVLLTWLILLVPVARMVWQAAF